MRAASLFAALSLGLVAGCAASDEGESRDAVLDASSAADVVDHDAPVEAGRLDARGDAFGSDAFDASYDPAECWQLSKLAVSSPAFDPPSPPVGGAATLTLSLSNADSKNYLGRPGVEVVAITPGATLDRPVVIVPDVPGRGAVELTFVVRFGAGLRARDLVKLAARVVSDAQRACPGLSTIEFDVALAN